MAALLGGFQTPRAPGAPIPKPKAPAIPGGFQAPQQPPQPMAYAPAQQATNPVNTPKTPAQKPAGAPIASPPASTGGTPAQVTAPPMDSQYWIEYGKRNQQYQDQLSRNSFLAAGATANEGYAENALNQQFPRNIYNQRVRANQQGVLGSGMENTAISDVAQRYAAQRFQLTNGLTARLAQLGQDSQMATGDFATDATGLAAANRQRYIDAMLKDPAAFTPPAGGFTAPPTRMQVVQQAGFQTPYTTAAQRRQTVQRARKGRN